MIVHPCELVLINAGIEKAEDKVMHCLLFIGFGIALTLIECTESLFGGCPRIEIIFPMESLMRDDHEIIKCFYKGSAGLQAE